MTTTNRYSPEVRQRAVRMVFGHQAEYASQWVALDSIASKIGCTQETLRSWVRQAERDRGYAMVRPQPTPRQVMVAFIDDHGEVCGVEPICRVLPISPSTYHAHKARERDPSRTPTRMRRDAWLKVEITRVWHANFQVYGVRKVWRQLTREGFLVARCMVERMSARWAWPASCGASR